MQSPRDGGDRRHGSEYRDPSSHQACLRRAPPAWPDRRQARHQLVWWGGDLFERLQIDSAVDHRNLVREPSEAPSKHSAVVLGDGDEGCGDGELFTKRICACRALRRVPRSRSGDQGADAVPTRCRRRLPRNGRPGCPGRHSSHVFVRRGVPGASDRGAERVRSGKAPMPWPGGVWSRVVSDRFVPTTSVRGTPRALRDVPGSGTTRPTRELLPT